MIIVVTCCHCGCCLLCPIQQFLPSEVVCLLSWHHAPNKEDVDINPRWHDITLLRWLYRLFWLAYCLQHWGQITYVFWFLKWTSLMWRFSDISWKSEQSGKNIWSEVDNNSSPLWQYGHCFLLFLSFLMPGVSGLLCDDIPDVDSGPTPGPVVNCKVN